MHTNQVESPGFVCLGHGDGLKNRKKMRFTRNGSFSQILSQLLITLILNTTRSVILFNTLPYSRPSYLSFYRPLPNKRKKK